MRNVSILRRAVRGILREAAGASKITDLIGRIQEINAQIVQFYTESAEEEGEDLSSIEIPRLGINVGIDSGYNANVSFAVSGITYSGVLEPGTVSTMVRSSEANKLGSLLSVELPWGRIWIGQNDHNPCLNAWSVAQTFPTSGGWGPILYDIAIEVATQEAGGLTSDRSEVSDEARAVWDKYDTARGDVEKVQLDLSDDDIQSWMAEDEDQEPLWHRTPQQEDDCTQWSAIQDREGGTDWHVSPLSRLYRKPPTTMSALRKAGLLFTGKLTQ